MSSYTLEEKEANALSFSLNFSIPPMKINKEFAYLGFEKFLKQVSTQKTSKLNGESTFKVNLLAMAHKFCNFTLDRNTLINTKEIKEAIKKKKTIMT